MKHLLALLLTLFGSITYAGSINGFNTDNALINTTDIKRGGPPRDGIPAIDNPKYITANDAHWLSATDRIIGVFYQGEARAYPIKIMNWHEIVNTQFSSEPVVVSFCPLCGTGMVFKANVKADKHSNKVSVLNFGVSGLLYQSDMLLYDRNTESLWSQLMNRAVTGPLKGSRLDMLVSHHTSFEQWRKTYPETLVLDIKTGFQRNYERNPYQGYDTSNNIMFPVNNSFPRQYHPKDEVFGLEYQDHFLAIPYRELSKTDATEITYQWRDKNWTIHWQPETPTVWVKDDKGQLIAGVRSFMFAWYAFHPDTDLFKQ